MEATRERIKTPPPGIYYDIPMEEYLAWDAWSRSDIAAMQVSPEYCYWSRWEKAEKDTAATSFGDLAHVGVLEPHLWPPEDVRWVEGPYNKNPFKRDKADAEADGYRVFKPEIRDRVEALVKRCREHEFIKALLDLSGDEREVCAVAICPVSGLLLKARCDLRAPSISVIADLKTTTTGTDPHNFQRSMSKWNWHLSGPHYTEVFGLAEGREYDKYLFLVSAQDAPYQPRVYSLDPETLEAGRDLNHMLRRKVKHCLKTKAWPSPEGIESVGMPYWTKSEIAAALEREAQES
jgi:hypothetical protein